MTGPPCKVTAPLGTTLSAVVPDAANTAVPDGGVVAVTLFHETVAVPAPVAVAVPVEMKLPVLVFTVVVVVGC